MKKLVLGMLILSSFLHATDYTSLSTENLVNLRGTVPVEDRNTYKAVMQERTSTLSYDEKVAMGIAQKRNTTSTSNGTTIRQRFQDGSGLGSRGASSRGRGKR